MFEIEHGVLKKYIPEDKEEHITIPQEVFHINGGAFSNCPYLVSVTFPAKVHSIYDNTFINCPRLSSVIFSNDFQGIGSCSTKDSSGPFVDCPKLKHLDLPATVKRVRLGSSDIESVRIYEGLVKLPNNIFSGCEKLRKVYLPASVEAIEEAAFIDCVELEYVKLPSGLKTIGLMAFWGCKKLRSIELPETVTKIGNDCFNGCGLEEVKLPEGIEIIEECTFSKCKNLCSFIIPESVKEIHRHAFWGSGLKSIRLPENVEVVGAGAFYLCEDLTEATIASPSTKFVHNVNPVFPEHTILKGENHVIPGKFNGTKFALVLIGATLLNVFAALLLLVAIICTYIYLKRKYKGFSLKSIDDIKEIYRKEFYRPWYKRLPIYDGELSEELAD